MYGHFRCASTTAVTRVRRNIKICDFFSGIEYVSHMQNK